MPAWALARYSTATPIISHKDQSRIVGADAVLLKNPQKAARKPKESVFRCAVSDVP